MELNNDFIFLVILYSRGKWVGFYFLRGFVGFMGVLGNGFN